MMLVEIDRNGRAPVPTEPGPTPAPRVAPCRASADGVVPKAEAAAGAEAAAPPPPRVVRVARATGAALRLLAWLVHGVLDGAILGGASSAQALLPLGFAISVCAVQDVAAFGVFLSARGASRRAVLAALLAFAAAFPAGAAASLAAQSQLHGSSAWDGVSCPSTGARPGGLSRGWPSSPRPSNHVTRCSVAGVSRHQPALAT